MLQKLLFLEPGQLNRLIPFFIFYSVLFCLLIIGDNISISLFIKNMGIENFSYCFLITGVVNFISVFIYLIYVDKVSNLSIFKIIVVFSVLLFVSGWLAIFTNNIYFSYGLLLIAREFIYTMFTMHFGNFILDYFNRDELNRVLPIIYSGGRVGGIIGSLLILLFTQFLSVQNLVILYAAIGLVCFIFFKYFSKLKLNTDDNTNIVENENSSNNQNDLIQIFKELLKSPFFIWLCISTILFILTRTFLFFEYNNYFEVNFKNEADISRFLSYYMIVSLVITMLIQLFALNRIINIIGLKGTYVIYNGLLMVVMLGNVYFMNVYTLILSRFFETEFRYSFRNNIVMLITNKFNKRLRARVRAFTMGVLIPLSTVAGSIGIGFFVSNEIVNIVSIAGFIICIIYFASTIIMYKYFED
ncbi:MAG: MFS transporter [Cyanobacteriota bacterium]